MTATDPRTLARELAHSIAFYPTNLAEEHATTMIHNALLRYGDQRAAEASEAAEAKGYAKGLERAIGACLTYARAHKMLAIEAQDEHDECTADLELGCSHGGSDCADRIRALSTAAGEKEEQTR